MNEDSNFWKNAHLEEVNRAVNQDVHGVVKVMPSMSITEVVSDTLSYLGETYGGATDTYASWRIIRITINDGVTRAEAAGDGGFKYKWSERASLFEDPGVLVEPPQFLQSFPTQFDNVVLSYFADTSRIQTAVYKLGADVVKTATMTYDGSNRLATLTWS